MFYEVDVEDYVRVEPRLFGFKTVDAVAKQLQETYADYHDKEIGEVIGVISVTEVGDGIIIPGDGAAYYKSRFRLIVWKPELQEMVFGIVDEITNFGAFMNLGVMKGMIHISQTMEDYVSFSTTNTLMGKDTKRLLKRGDSCLARVVALSYKGDMPKIGLTMRQPGLGKLDWIKEEKKKTKVAAKKAGKEVAEVAEEKVEEKKEEKPSGKETTKSQAKEVKSAEKAEKKPAEVSEGKKEEKKVEKKEEKKEEKPKEKKK